MLYGTLLFIALFYTHLLISGQRNYSAAEISRLADLGKIWDIAQFSSFYCERYHQHR